MCDALDNDLFYYCGSMFIVNQAKERSFLQTNKTAKASIK